jgi:hypothetical protein
MNKKKCGKIKSIKKTPVGYMSMQDMEKAIGTKDMPIKEIVKKAKAYYRRNIQSIVNVDGKDTRLRLPVNNKDLEGIDFPGSGIRESTSKGAFYERIILVPFLRDIAQKGDYVGNAENEQYPQYSSIKTWHYIQAWVEIGEEKEKAQIDIAEDKNGKRFYFVARITKKKGH